MGATASKARGLVISVHNVLKMQAGRHYNKQRREKSHPNIVGQCTERAPEGFIKPMQVLPLVLRDTLLTESNH